MKGTSITRREFVRAGAAGVVAATCGCQTTHSSGHPYHPLPYAAQIQVPNPAKLRILQLTDVHLGTDTRRLDAIRNKRTERLIADLVARAKPDLVIVTGDTWSGNRQPGGEDRMREAVPKYEALGVPWAYVWGNHDLLIEDNAGHAALTEAANSLYRGAAFNGNYVIDVLDKRGSRVCQLVCMNSEDDGLGPLEQAWMKQLAEDTADSGDPQPPRYAFFHIPIKQYAEIWDNGAASGIKGEEPCIEKEDGSSFAYLKMLGVRACFCGHDHVNCYSGVIDGVDLVYGRAAGGYGADRVPKGGSRITINCRTGHFEWAVLIPGAPKWKPRPGKRVTIPEPEM